MLMHAKPPGFHSLVLCERDITLPTGLVHYRCCLLQMLMHWKLSTETLKKKSKANKKWKARWLYRVLTNLERFSLGGCCR